MLAVILILNLIIVVGLFFMIKQLEKKTEKNFKDAADIFVKHEIAIREIVDLLDGEDPGIEVIVHAEDKSKLH